MNPDDFSSLEQIIFNYIEIKKTDGLKLNQENIRVCIDEALNFTSRKCSDEVKEEIYKDVEYRYKVKHTKGSVIYKEYSRRKDWYFNSEQTNTYFWRRYKQSLLDNNSFSVSSISLLENTTLPQILNCLSNPCDKLESSRFTRGLVIGDVQSGKTATYVGLIAKAADAGFKVVILLAGITESLRKQTQLRLDKGIIGQTIHKIGKQKEKSERVGVGIDGKPLRAISMTSCVSDFIEGTHKITMSLDASNSLVVLVVKKNVSVLTKLKNWLINNNLDSRTGYIEEPMLLIDDEADNASVNTKKEESDPTSTNKLIREICSSFRDANYVGFTATPFANVFIDPDSVDQMNHQDLFPEDFIYALNAPSNYLGAKQIFSPEGECYRNLCFINDIAEPDYFSDEYRDNVKNHIDELNQGAFYYKHHKEWRGKLPASLFDSVLCFFIANVIRDLRGQTSAHRSMLVNISRFVAVQKYISEKISVFYENVVNDVRTNFHQDTSYNVSLPLYKKLLALWNQHFYEVKDVTFERVINKDNFLSSIAQIEVRVVNASKQSSPLDYDTQKGLRVIAVGGLALSRGLTLEGLLVSYFYRNTATFDVLMQMGRWFGYRDAYKDIFQIWTSQTSAVWYAEIANASEELKEDLKSMYDQRLTPKEFGIKVRNDSYELQITAANKMRSATNMEYIESFYGNIYDTPYASYSAEDNKHNHEVIGKLVKTLQLQGHKLKFAKYDLNLKHDVNDKLIGSSRYFEKVPKSEIIKLINDIKCSLANMYFNKENLLDFLNCDSNSGLDYWNVEFVGGASEKKYPYYGLDMIKCVERTISPCDRNAVQLNSRRRLISGGAGRDTLTPDEIAEAEKRCRENREEANRDKEIPNKAYFQYLPNRSPILQILLIQPSSPSVDPNKKELPQLTKYREELNGDAIVAFAIGCPLVHGKSYGKKRYKINKVLQRYYEEDNEQEDIDEE